MMNRTIHSRQSTRPTSGEERSLNEYFDAIRSIEGPGPNDIETMIARAGSQAGTSAAGGNTLLSGLKGKIGLRLGIAGIVGVASVGAILLLNTIQTIEQAGTHEGSGKELATAAHSTIAEHSPILTEQPPSTNESNGLHSDRKPSTADTSLAQVSFNQTEKNTKRLELPQEPEVPLSIRAEWKIATDSRKPDYTAYAVYNPKSLNSSAADYAPSVSPDGKHLYFVSNRTSGSGKGGHDIWTARKRDPLDLEFDQPVNIGEPINTEMNEGTMTISPDGNTMYITACNRLDGLGDCDLYEAKLTDGKWGDMRNLVAINSPYWDSQPTLSESGDTLYFTSNRIGTLGGDEDSDIYMAIRGEDGEWKTPVNLGEPINTPQREDSPFIVPGANKLYFSSAGHGGYGKLDFFVAERNDGGTWGEPQNLGPVFNTPQDERMLTTTADEEVFYFASERSAPTNLGTLDIFMALRSNTPTSSTDASPIEPDVRMEERGILTIVAQPNPATEVVSLKVAVDAPLSSDEQAIIVNQMGEAVMHLPASALNAPIPIPDLPNGLYLVRVGKFSGSFIVRR